MAGLPGLFGQVADQAGRAAAAIERVAAAVEALNGCEAVVTIRYVVNDDAVRDHPLLGDQATVESALTGKGRRHGHQP